MTLDIRPAPYHPARRDQFAVNASHRGAYVIDVSIPAGLASGERLPVLLLVDGNWTFEVAHAITHGAFATLAADVPRVVMVGVGYPEREGFAGAYTRRNWDFHGPWDLQDAIGAEMRGVFKNIGGAGALKPGGGYEAFISFLRDELLPGLAQTYPIDLAARHCLIGHSSGGHFALRALFDPHSPFSRYVAISPSLGTAAGEIEAAEAAYAASHDDLAADIFVCAGTAEVAQSRPMGLCAFGGGVTWLVEQLSIRNWPSAKFAWEFMGNESHSSIAPRAIAAGLRSVFRMRPGVHV